MKITSTDGKSEEIVFYYNGNINTDSSIFGKVLMKNGNTIKIDLSGLFYLENSSYCKLQGVSCKFPDGTETEVESVCKTITKQVYSTKRYDFSGIDFYGWEETTGAWEGDFLYFTFFVLADKELITIYKKILLMYDGATIDSLSIEDSRLRDDNTVSYVLNINDHKVFAQSGNFQNEYSDETVVLKSGIFDETDTTETDYIENWGNTSDLIENVCFYEEKDTGVIKIKFGSGEYYNYKLYLGIVDCTNSYIFDGNYLEKIIDISDKISMEGTVGTYTLENYCSDKNYRYRVMLSDTDNYVGSKTIFNKEEETYKGLYEESGNTLQWSWKPHPDVIKKYQVQLLKNDGSETVYQSSGAVETGDFKLIVNKNIISLEDKPTSYLMTYYDCYGRSITHEDTINYGAWNADEKISASIQNTQNDYDLKFVVNTTDESDTPISYVEIMLNTDTYSTELCCDSYDEKIEKYTYTYKVSGYKLGSFSKQDIIIIVHCGKYQKLIKKENITFTYKNSYISDLSIQSFKKVGYDNFNIYMTWNSKSKSSHADIVFADDEKTLIVKTLKPSDGKYIFYWSSNLLEQENVNYSICEYFTSSNTSLVATSKETEFYVSQSTLLTQNIPSDFDNSVVSILTANRLSWDFVNKYGYLESKQGISIGSCQELLYTSGSSDETYSEYSNVSYVLKYTLPPFDLYEKMKYGQQSHVQIGTYYYDVYRTDDVYFRERRFLINDVIYKRYDLVTPDLFDCDQLTVGQTISCQLKVKISNLSSYYKTSDDGIFYEAEIPSKIFAKQITGLACYFGHRDDSMVYDLYLTCTVDPTNYKIYLFHNFGKTLFYRDITDYFEEKTIDKTTKNYCHFSILKNRTNKSSLCVAAVGSNNRVYYATVQV